MITIKAITLAAGIWRAALILPNDELPFKMSFGDEDILDSIVNQLQDQGIDASWDDVMDVS